MPISEESVGAGVVGRQVAGRIPAGRVPLVVQDLRRRHVHVLPACRGETISEVHVLHVHEVALVEPRDLVESGPAQQQARPGQPADRAFAGLQALLAVGRPSTGSTSRSVRRRRACRRGSGSAGGAPTGRPSRRDRGSADRAPRRAATARRPPAWRRCCLGPTPRRGWPRRRTRSHPSSPGRPGTRQRHGSRRSRSRGWRRCAAAGLLGDVRGPPPARRRWTRCRPSRRSPPARWRATRLARNRSRCGPGE